MNAPQPEIVAVQHTGGSAEVTVRATPLNIYQGTCTDHNRPVRYDADRDLGDATLIPCPDGDHKIFGKRLVGVASNVTCDGSCWAAICDRCSCACGGHNHGRSWMLSSAFATMSDEALTEAWRGARLSTREVFADELAKWRAAREQAAKAKAARTERARVTRERKAKVTFQEWATANAKVIEALRPWRGSESNRFLADLALQVTDGRGGVPKPLSEGQVNAARDAIMTERRRARLLAEREAARRPAPVGKTTITGRVVKVSYRTRNAEGERYEWGPQYRMTVSCDGYAVQVSVPAAVARWARANRCKTLNEDWRPNDFDEHIAERWTNALRGLQVSLTTTVKPSGRDASFGFGSGATGVRILAEPDREAGA